VYEHSARSVANAMQHSNMFLMPLWRILGKATWVVRGRTLPKTLFVAALVLLSIVALCTVRKDLEMKATGQLQPLDRRDVFVDVDGEVVDVLVRHGQRVEADRPLIQLRNTELNYRLAEIAGRRKSTYEQLLSVENLRRERNLSQEEQNRLSGQRAELMQRLNSLDQQYELLQEKLDRLTIRSPIAGEVVAANDKLADAQAAHRDLEGRKTTGSIVLVP
jgi:multidrug efflux pump subunit AcrA (membrane-fusion protein)